ncbi:hypothetical protein GIB67_016734, partial [Kingdonia uniflora]
TVPFGYLAAVADLDDAAQYDWGSTILAFLYHVLDTEVTTGGAITDFPNFLRYTNIFSLHATNQIYSNKCLKYKYNYFLCCSEMQYWFYEYCGVGLPIVKEEVKFLAYLHLRAWERGNRRKTNIQATNFFILGRYHIDHRTIETITWEPWTDSAMSEIDDILTVKLLSRKRMLLQVPNRNCEYYLGDRCWRQLIGEEHIHLDHPLSMSPHISPTALQEMRQPGSLTVTSL